MGWSIGYDNNWNRDIGYGVPAICDHPDCHEAIDRGLGYVCGGDAYGGEHGCGLFFCEKHHSLLCERCAQGKDPFTPKPDTLEWVVWKLTESSWEAWRQENSEQVKVLSERLRANSPRLAEIISTSSM